MCIDCVFYCVIRMNVKNTGGKRDVKQRKLLLVRDSSDDNFQYSHLS